MSAKQSHAMRLWAEAHRPKTTEPGRVQDLPPSYGPIDPHVAYSAMNSARDYRSQGLIEDADGRIRIYDDKLDCFLLWNVVREDDLVTKFKGMKIPYLPQLTDAISRDIDFSRLMWDKWQDGDFDVFETYTEATAFYRNRVTLRVLRDAG